MNNENYWLTSFDTTFPLDKNSKKSYNGINTLQKNKNVFDDTFANSALDYLYSNDNQGKTQSFLENNGFPSIEERQYNKEAYGAADENRQMLDLFQSKSNSILNPKLSDDTDRAFLSGLMGEEEEKAYHQNQIADANSAIKQWQSAFRGSPLESQLNGAADSALQKINTVQTAEPVFSNEKNKTVAALDSNAEYDITQYFDNNKIKENAKMNDKSVKNIQRSSAVIAKNADSIKRAANKYGVNPAIMAACIYTEQVLNYNVLDSLIDKITWLDPSVGIAQVRISTAKTIEENTNIEKIQHLGKKEEWHGNNSVARDIWYVPGYGKFIGTKEDAISKRLSNDEQCIEYVAAYLKLIQDLWREEYPIIDGKTDILATLYNIGEYGSKGINSDPRPTPFGIFAKKNYYYMRYLLGLE